MIKVFVCDDEKNICHHITDIIDKQIIIQNYDMEMTCSTTSPETLLSAIKKEETKRHLYFLDVELRHKEFDGFLLGKEIRAIDPNGSIVYITSYKDLAYKTFQYHLEAFDYIVKDVPEKLTESIAQCLASLVEKLQVENKDPITCYTIKSGDMIHHIPLEDIYYFETSTRSHYVILYGKNQYIEFLGNISSIQKELSESFIKVHRSYLVSIQKIESVDLKHQTLTVAGQTLPISRREKSNLLNKIGSL